MTNIRTLSIVGICTLVLLTLALAPASAQTETVSVNVTSALNATGEEAFYDLAELTSSVSEKFLSYPTIEYDQKDSYFAVEDTVTITNTNTTEVGNATEVNVTVSYPGYYGTPAISKDVGSYQHALILNNSGTATKTLSYMKNGPYVSKIYDTTTVNSDKRTKIAVISHEALLSDVDFTFDPDESPWDEYFPNFDYTTLEVKVNNVKTSKWKETAAGLKIYDTSLNDGTNTIQFTWTPVVVPLVVPPPVAVVWYAEEYVGIPLWLWVISTMLIVAAIVIAFYPKKE